MRIEKAKTADIPAMLQIYNHYIQNSTATFHIHPIDKDKFRSDFFHDDGFYVTFVIKDDDSVAGFCALSQFNSKEAYKRSAYVSVYIDKNSTGRGYGKKALGLLEEKAAEKGIGSLIALICTENERSIRLFEKNGYKMTGRLENAGEKFGRMLDVAYYQKLI